MLLWRSYTCQNNVILSGFVPFFELFIVCILTGEMFVFVQLMKIEWRTRRTEQDHPAVG